uniref:Uncharacterized protein n=1 Tax=Anguilla anguilla TaxID=7936 RepID=A0A0E9PN17_ANGAN
MFREIIYSLKPHYVRNSCACIHRGSPGLNLRATEIEHPVPVMGPVGLL